MQNRERHGASRRLLPLLAPLHKFSVIIAGIAIRGLTSPARREPGEPRDVSLRILFAKSDGKNQNPIQLAWIGGKDGELAMPKAGAG